MKGSNPGAIPENPKQMKESNPGAMPENSRQKKGIKSEQDAGEPKTK